MACRDKTALAPECLQQRFNYVLHRLALQQGYRIPGKRSGGHEKQTRYMRFLHCTPCVGQRASMLQQTSRFSFDAPVCGSKLRNARQQHMATATAAALNIGTHEKLWFFPTRTSTNKSFAEVRRCYIKQ